MSTILKLILFFILLIVIGVAWYVNYRHKHQKTEGYVWVGDGPDPFAKKEEDEKKE